MPIGLFWTAIGAPTVPDARSIRLTLSLSPFATQRNCLPSERPSGPAPTGRSAVPARLEAGDGPVVGVGHPDDAVGRHRCRGCGQPGSARRCARCVLASSRVSEFPLELETHDRVARHGDAVGAVAGRDGCTTLGAGPGRSTVWSLAVPPPPENTPATARIPTTTPRTEAAPANADRHARGSGAALAAESQALPRGGRRGLGGGPRAWPGRGRRAGAVGGAAGAVARGPPGPVARLRSGCDGSAPVSAARAARPRSPAEG